MPRRKTAKKTNGAASGETNMRVNARAFTLLEAMKRINLGIAPEDARRVAEHTTDNDASLISEALEILGDAFDKANAEKGALAKAEAAAKEKTKRLAERREREAANA